MGGRRSLEDWSKSAGIFMSLDGDWLYRCLNRVFIV